MKVVEELFAWFLAVCGFVKNKKSKSELNPVYLKYQLKNDYYWNELIFITSFSNSSRVTIDLFLYLDR